MEANADLCGVCEGTGRLLDMQCPLCDADPLQELLGELQEEAAKENERPAALGKLEISITPPGPVDRDTAKRFEDLGVDRLILMRGMTDMVGLGSDESRDGVFTFIEETARQFDLG